MLALVGSSPLSFQLTPVLRAPVATAAVAGPQMMFGGGDKDKEGGGFMCVQPRMAGSLLSYQSHMLAPCPVALPLRRAFPLLLITAMCITSLFFLL